MAFQVKRKSGVSFIQVSEGDKDSSSKPLTSQRRQCASGWKPFSKACLFLLEAPIVWVARKVKAPVLKQRFLPHDMQKMETLIPSALSQGTSSWEEDTPAPVRATPAKGSLHFSLLLSKRPQASPKSKDFPRPLGRLSCF